MAEFSFLATSKLRLLACKPNTKVPAPWALEVWESQWIEINKSALALLAISPRLKRSTKWSLSLVYITLMSWFASKRSPALSAIFRAIIFSI